MSQLSLVPDIDDDFPGRRAAQLMRMAKAAGEQQVTNWLKTLELVILQAQEIVNGGDVYPAGVRDIASKLVEYNAYKAQSIYSIMRPSTPQPAAFTAAAKLPAEAPVARTQADEDFAADFPG